MIMKYLLLVQALGGYLVYFVLNYHLWISEICKVQCACSLIFSFFSCSCVITFFFSYPQISYQFNRKLIELLVCEIVLDMNQIWTFQWTILISFLSRTECKWVHVWSFFYRLLSRPENWLTEEHARVQIWENVLSKCESDNAGFVWVVKVSGLHLSTPPIDLID